VSLGGVAVDTVEDTSTLLLFDIDGTLLQGATRAHAAALRQALITVHGVDPDAAGIRVSAAGRTDGEIARAILLDAGVSAERIDERADAVCEETCRIFAQTCDADLSPFLIDGIPQLLDWLAGSGRVRLALVTGNYEPVARLKLKRAGIGHWFESGQGGFGSDSEDRLALPPIARRRAGGGPGHPHPRERTIVIGDTPRDIACAHADALRCVAVATGPYPPEELTAADVVVNPASELRRVLAAELNGNG
jgi:phosphoglycolate phosphatase-like HAD superfamily hydrolase